MSQSPFPVLLFFFLPFQPLFLQFLQPLLPFLTLRIFLIAATPFVLDNTIITIITIITIRFLKIPRQMISLPCKPITNLQCWVSMFRKEGFDVIVVVLEGEDKGSV